MGQFALQLSEFAKKAGENADVIVRRVVTDMLARVIDRSPVGNATLWKEPAPKGYSGGRFRGNWQVSIGKPATGVLSRVDKTGEATLEAGKRVLAEFQCGPDIWLVNNLPYGPRLEYEGWSKQVPNGMVRVTVSEYEGIVKKAVGETKP